MKIKKLALLLISHPNFEVSNDEITSIIVDEGIISIKGEYANPFGGPETTKMDMTVVESEVDEIIEKERDGTLNKIFGVEVVVENGSQSIERQITEGDEIEHEIEK